MSVSSLIPTVSYSRVRVIFSSSLYPSQCLRVNKDMPVHYKVFKEKLRFSRSFLQNQGSAI